MLSDHSVCTTECEVTQQGFIWLIIETARLAASENNLLPHSYLSLQFHLLLYDNLFAHTAQCEYRALTFLFLHVTFYMFI